MHNAEWQTLRMNVPIVTNFDKSGIDKLDTAAHPQNKPLARLALFAIIRYYFNFFNYSNHFNVSNLI